MCDLFYHHFIKASAQDMCPLFKGFSSPGPIIKQDRDLAVKRHTVKSQHGEAAQGKREAVGDIGAAGPAGKVRYLKIFSDKRCF